MSKLDDAPMTRQGVRDLDALSPRRSPGKPALVGVDATKLFCSHSYQRKLMGIDPVTGQPAWDDVCEKCGSKRSD